MPSLNTCTSCGSRGKLTNSLCDTCLLQQKVAFLVNQQRQLNAQLAELGTSNQVVPQDTQDTRLSVPSQGQGSGKVAKLADILSDNTTPAIQRIIHKDKRLSGVEFVLPSSHVIQAERSTADILRFVAWSFDGITLSGLIEFKNVRDAEVFLRVNGNFGYEAYDRRGSLLEKGYVIPVARTEPGRMQLSIRFSKTNTYAAWYRVVI